MKKKLSSKQKSRVKWLTGSLIVACIIAGLCYLVAWTGETTYTQLYCSGRTGITITHYEGDGPTFTITYNDAECK